MYLLDNIYGNSVYYEHFPDDYVHLFELTKKIKDMDVSSFGEIRRQEFRWIERDLEKHLKKFSQYGHDVSMETEDEQMS